ncbi:MAG: polysaccharide deacetylase family protein [Flavobacteriales bacterium]|nr:polysaccharide deacetylase family protein [Flavobacteriales bacterium]
MILAVNYHYIRKDFNNPYPAIFGVKPTEFRNQLEILSRFGSFISQEELRIRIRNNEKPSSNKIEFLITFDDGLKEQYDEGLPILNEMGIPAVFYVNTINFENHEFSLVHQIHLLRSQIPSAKLYSDLSGSYNIFLSETEKTEAANHYRYDDAETAELKYLLNFKLSLSQQEEIIQQQFPLYFDQPEQIHHNLYMSKSQLKTLADSGYLGTHSHKHIPLGLYSVEEIRKQILDSKNYLESLCNTEIYSIGYPYGSKEACTDVVSDVAAETGLEFGFTTERAGIFNFNKPFLLPRFNCNDLPGGKSNTYSDLKASEIPVSYR